MSRTSVALLRPWRSITNVFAVATLVSLPFQTVETHSRRCLPVPSQPYPSLLLMERIKAYRLVLDRSIDSEEAVPTKLATPEDVVRVVWELTRDEPVEVFLVLLLDTQHCVKPRGIRTVSRGTLMSSLVHPREVFSHAIDARAAAVILAHNHPGTRGSVQPSPDDIAVTKQLVAVGNLLEIPVIDHVIVGPDGTSYSFLANKKL
jgi:DNA repair protein RadC